MSRMFWSTGCIVAASLLTASNASAGSGYEYYAPYGKRSIQLWNEGLSQANVTRS